MAHKKNNNRPVAVDLFCGAGGMSLGIEQAGFDVLLGIDRDGYHVATHERNFPYGKSLCASVTDVKARTIFDAIECNEVDLIVGGPPCQGFSYMGLRDVSDDRNNLVDEFVRIVKEVQPKAFIMENVPGMLSGRTKEYLDRALKGFAKAGYRIAKPVQIVNAADFGVPQNRRRLILLGVRNDFESDIEYPETHDARTTVWEAISDLPDVDSIPALFTEDTTSYSIDPVSTYAQTMRGLIKSQNDYSYNRIWDAKICTGCARVNHTDKAKNLYSNTPIGEMVPGHKLPKLDPNGLCTTLRAGSDSSHGSYTAPRPIHPFKPRCITIREAARLHGYPDWFRFYPSKWHAYRQIGNSVCPPVANVLGASVARAIRYKPTKPRIRMALGDRYELPPDRPRTLKRIPQILHYPPVIEFLFRERFDAKRGKISKPSFTFDDVQRAIRETGVELTWVKAETFLSEIARSRNVTKLLEPCLSRGYSIRKIVDGDKIGEFVTANDPLGIQMKSVEKSKEVRRAQPSLF